MWAGVVAPQVVEVKPAPVERSMATQLAQPPLPFFDTVARSERPSPSKSPSKVWYWPIAVVVTCHWPLPA